MSEPSPETAGNGARAFPAATALVVDSKIERHLALRRALRETGLFGAILSAESPETAGEILTDTGTPELFLILVAANLSEPVLASATEAQLGRSVIVSELPVPGAARPVLVTPVTPEAIDEVLARLQ